MAVMRMQGKESAERKGRKIISHIEIHPVLGGGHMVKHVFSSFDHPPREYHFAPNESVRAINHVARYSGLAMPGAHASGQAGESDEDQP